MERKIILSIVLVFIFLSVCLAFAFAFIDFPEGKVIYVRKTENLRMEPQGKKIGLLEKGVSMVVVEDSPKWVKVRIEGWIWKDSVTDSKIGLSGDGYRALQIVVKTQAMAESILSELQAGGDFEKIAKSKSIGPAAKKGGDLGYFNKGDFQADFEAVILNLKPSEISTIIKSNVGYHIFKRVK